MSAATDTTQETAAPSASWRRFMSAVAFTAGLALAVGLALSYASVYRVAYNAGFDTAWIDAGTWQLRPAHLFPLTLDLPVLVGYAGTIALAGRRSVAWARLVLVACAAATIAAQIVDAAGWVLEHTWVKALIHGWPPAFAVLTAHLLVKILQALGFLVPPVAEESPSWASRAGRGVAAFGLWVVATVADIRDARRAARADTRQGAEQDTQPDATEDTGQDIEPDAAADSVVDTRTGTELPAEADTQPDSALDVPHVVVPFTGQKGRLVAAVMAGNMTKAAAAKRAKVDPKTVSRWVKAAEAAQAKAKPQAVAQ